MSARDRRQGNSSEFSASLSVAANRADTLQELLEAQLGRELAGSSLDQQLQRLLSFRSVISTSSSLAEAQQAASGGATSFPEIGEGSIGRIFEHPGRTVCYKLPLTNDQSQYHKLFNNYRQQLIIAGSFDNFALNNPGQLIEVTVPRAYFFATKKTTEFWDENKDMFDWSDLPEVGQAFCMERIFPVPNPLRQLLIDRFCKPELRAAARADPKNKQCLIRPMLGREITRQNALGFNLRNYTLSVDKLQELGLPAKEYAEAMAGAFAVMHWQAKLDGNDVEFVLGSAPTRDTEYENARRFTVEEARALRKDQETYSMVLGARNNFKRRVMSLWMLDFDACNEITIDSAGVLAAVKAFTGTFAYTPRPDATDEYQQNLWSTFTKRYEEVSKLILPENSRHLPGLFITEVTKRILEMRSRDPGVQSPRSPPGRGRGGSTSTLPYRPSSGPVTSPSSGHGCRFGSIDEGAGSGPYAAGSWRSPGGSGSGNRSGGFRGSDGGREHGDSTGSPVRRGRGDVPPRSGRGFGSGFGSGGGRGHGDTTGSPASRERGDAAPQGGQGRDSGSGDRRGRE
ncbi:hypothetical protein LTR27_010312 [Elasticomyces elasticus]|nr:hypothetical protein LTR27_010312 [Elasticomyces elasticus]